VQPIVIRGVAGDQQAALIRAGPVPRPGIDEIDLRQPASFRPAEHRRRGRAVHRSAVDDNRLSNSPASGITRSRGFGDLHCWRGRCNGFGWPHHHRGRPAMRGSRREGRPDAGCCVLRSGLRRASARLLLGSGCLRGAMFGLTRNSVPALARRRSKALPSRHDLLDAMRADSPPASETVLRVDGGMVASDWTMQRLADILEFRSTGRWCRKRQRLARPISPAARQDFIRPRGIRQGLGSGTRRFSPGMAEPERLRRLALWRDAVSRTLTKRG